MPTNRKPGLPCSTLPHCSVHFFFFLTRINTHSTCHWCGVSVRGQEPCLGWPDAPAGSVPLPWALGHCPVASTLTSGHSRASDAS